MSKKHVEEPVGLLHVQVLSRKTTYFYGDALQVSATNETGNFDILPQHHNFITLLSTGDMVITTPGQPNTIPIVRGVMHVKDDIVTVFIDV
jgi:F0F1-type ATP synthase epsilon subunit